jgi:pilus assembly protein CpaB
MDAIGFSSMSRVLRRHRRTASALAAGVSVLALGMALRPPQPATVDVVVASHDLIAGHRLSDEDLARAAVPAALLPPGVHSDLADLSGQVLAAPVARGEAISTTRLADPLGSGWSAPPGTSPLPMRFSDGGAAGLLSPGQRLDVLAAAAPGVEDLGPGVQLARLVAQDVLVLSITSSPEEAGLPSTGSGGDGESPVVVLAATRAQALAIVGAQVSSKLSFVIVPA